MKPIPLLLAATLAVSLALPSSAQTSIEAPNGWKTQTKAQGATTFTPPNLKTGEIYSVTVYDSVSLNGQTLGEYLRKFAGPVGKTEGNLAAPLKIEKREGKLATGIGFYNGPNGVALGVVFYGVSLDGTNIHVMRTLVSEGAPVERYQSRQGEILLSMSRRAADAKAEAENNIAPSDNAPSRETRRLVELGGPIVPGIYAGDQYDGEELKFRLRVYLYPNGEYRIRDGNDGAFQSKYGVATPDAGSYSYDPESGRLDIADGGFSLSNGSSERCFYGRNRAGKPAIYAESSGLSVLTPVVHTALTLVAPLTQNDLPSVVKARDEAREKAKLATAAALERQRKAKYDAIKTTLAPGRGVPNAQIAAILHNRDASSFSTYNPGVGYFSPGITMPGHPEDFVAGHWVQPPSTTQFYSSNTDEAYLLLKDGTAYRGLQCAPDQLDVRAARRKDPDRWGKWKRVNGKIHLSFEGKPYEALPTENPGQEFRQVLPSAPGTRFSGHYTAFERSEVSLDITFFASGRFKRKVDPEKDYSAPFILSKATQPARGGDSAGTYSINGYSMTLRYDSGTLERMPFFFLDKNRETLWFEGHQVGLYDNLINLLKKKNGQTK